MTPNAHIQNPRLSRAPSIATSDRSTAEIESMFRKALRAFPASVCIATAFDEGRPVGMTMTSVTSVSMDPPALLICVHRAAALQRALSHGSLFCVNLLNDENQEIATAFAGGKSHSDRFEVGTWRIGGSEAPWLVNARANLFCRVATALVYGTHMIFVGDAIDVRVQPGSPTLLYADGGYAKL
jgi:flavin reductase (DIM6/NTAB) family NADH-FMN oxidoreductase RutF